jgi:hypothetical protein
LINKCDHDNLRFSSDETTEGEPLGSPPAKTFDALGCLNDVDNATATLGAKGNNAGSKCEQSVVFALANVCAGVEVSSTLTNDDFTSVYNLTCVTLYAKALCV